MGFLQKLFGRRVESQAQRRKPPEERNLSVVKWSGGYNAFGYQSAKTAARDGRSGVAGSGDLHLQYDRVRLVEESRKLDRDNPIYQGMLDKAVSYIVANGFTIQARSEDPEWNAQAEAIWKSFWELPEIAGLDSGPMIEQMVCREILMAGDVGVLKTNVGLLQLIESEQIRGPNAATLDGLQRDESGRVSGFWVAPYERGSVQYAAAKRYKRDELLFVVRRRRPSAYRATPPCQASFAMLHRINDTCDSEAIARQLQSRLALSITRPNAANLMHQFSKEDDKGSDTEGKLTTRVVDFDYAVVVSGEPGDEIKGIERTAPGRDFPQTIEAFLRLLGLPLGLPLEIILLDWTKSNYSQSRAVLEQAFTGFIGWQSVLQRQFYEPIYRWVIDRAIASRELSAREDQYRHEWIKPTFPWIDQLAEAQAYGAKLDRSLCTHAAVLKSLNQDREEVVSAREREVRDAIERAKRIEQQTGVQVPWEPFAGLQYSVNAAVRPAKTEQEEESGASDTDEDESESKQATEKIIERNDRGQIARVIERTIREGGDA